MVFDGDEVIVPAKNILNHMGIELTYSGDTYTAVREDGACMEVTLGESEMKANGETYNIVEPYLYEDAILMLDFSAIEKAFGAELAPLTESSQKLDIKTNYKHPSYNTNFEWWEVNAKFTAGYNSVSYELNLPETADIKVMYKVTSPISWNVDTEEALYYRSAPAPKYIDGKWRGAFSTSLSGKYYGVKLIVDGEIYLKEYAVCTLESVNKSYSDYVAPQSAGLKLVPVYESVSYYLESSAEDCNVYFKKTGESEWEKAYKPYKDINADTKQFRGSIVNLEAATAYEIKAEELDANGEVINEYSKSFETWQENPTIAQTISLSDIYSGGSLLISHLNGSENGWIKIVGDENTPVIADGNIRDAVLFDNCSYLIFENITVIGGARNGINLTESCNNIRIVNCDISGWGRKGLFYKNEGVYKIDGDTPNWEAAIRLFCTDSVTVERCCIHDPKGSANLWDGKTYTGVHPCGPCGIYYYNSNATVIRYNDFVGNDEHLFNDAIEGAGNGSIGGGAGKNADIYGNYFANGADDATELDGSQMNVRYFKNRIENFTCGVSTAANTVGPSYIYQNQIYDLRDTGVTVGGGIKAGGLGESLYAGKMYIFNNTIDNYGYGIQGVGYNGISEYHVESRNNIYVSEGKRAVGYLDYGDERDSMDYDLIWKNTSISSDITGENIKYANPVYVDKEGGNMKLAEGSHGKNMAVLLDNFGGGTDVGVYGNSDISFMPYRPIGAAADKYRVMLSTNETRNVSVTFENSADLQGLKINKTGNWLTVDDVKISGATVTVNIGADADLCKNTECYGALMFETVSGYSIPIWVGMSLN